MGAIRKIYSSWVATLLLTVIVLLYWGSYLWPPVTYWYELRSLEVEDVRAGQPIQLRMDRSIHNPFIGTVTVIVRKQRPEGWEAVCNGTGAGDFPLDAILPKPTTLRWLSSGACDTLNEPGDYRVTTIITVLPGLHLRRTLIYESNIFRVTT